MRLFHTETLIYYDGPQLFVAKDADENKYLCDLVEEKRAESGLESRYYCIEVTTPRLEELLAGDIDLRTVYMEREFQNQYLLQWTTGGIEDSPVTLLAEDVPMSWIPNGGLLEKRE